MIAKDLLRHPHPLAVMNIIWPLTGLYMPFFGWLAWWYLGRKPSRQRKLALLLPSGLTGYASWQTILFPPRLCRRLYIRRHHHPANSHATQAFCISPALWLQAVICVMISLLAGLFFSFWPFASGNNFLLSVRYY